MGNTCDIIFPVDFLALNAPPSNRENVAAIDLRELHRSYLQKIQSYLDAVIPDT